MQFTGDYKADLYTASLTLGNPDLIHGTGVAVLHYLRAVTKNISLGAEFAYQVHDNLCLFSNLPLPLSRMTQWGIEWAFTAYHGWQN